MSNIHPTAIIDPAAQIDPSTTVGPYTIIGADVVIGTHPHVLQPVEWVQGADGHDALVYYSLGNFLSAQTDPACRLGAMARFTMVKTPQGCTVRDDGLLLVETREENGHYTAVLQE